MQLGFVGLGRMGLNMVTRLIRGGHQIVAYDRSADAVARAETAGARGVSSLEALAQALDAPRAVWVMVPAGDPDLVGLKGYVEDSGEGRWTLHEGIDRGVPLPALTAALFTRFRSRQDDPFAERLLAALRQQFGGHAVKKS